MKRQLGISIYPFKQTLDENKKYIKLAAKYGFTRLFTSLIEIEDDKKSREEQIIKLRDLCKFAGENNFEVVLDVNPNVFEKLGIVLPDVKFFKDMHVNTIRLDNPFDGITERNMTHNEYGINIELNASSFAKLIDFVLEVEPVKDRILCSHNFYPQRFSGLEYEYFAKMSKHYKEKGIRMSAFISSNVADTGPWAITEGLSTLEMHRDLPITTQAKHLWATDLIDDIIIANSFASEKELKELSELNPYSLTLDVEVEKNVSPIEKTIAFEYNNHFRRGDINEYVVRSTMTRVLYKDEPIVKLPNSQKKQGFGEIYIPNDDYKQYKGELHLILNDMPADSKKNYFGKVVKHEEFLIRYISPWKEFKLKQK